MPKIDNKKVTLSFDNGPHSEITPYVLDILANRGVKTSFFVVGQNLEKTRAPAERAADEGHWIGNHTWSHSEPFRTKGDAKFIREEIERTQELLGALSHSKKFFRPFGGMGRLDGALNGAAVDHLAQGNYTCILWNSIPGDFRDKHGWPQVANQQIAKLDWSLVVLHDIFAGAMSHLDRFIGSLQDQGYSFEQDFPPNCIAMQQGVSTKVMSEGVLAN